MNFVWITSDTLRRPDLGCYGNDKVFTTSIDALAAKSVKFNRHYAAGFPTMPARADFLTGRWTGVLMPWAPIPLGQQVLPQLLSRAGYHTAAVVDTPFYIRNNMNYDRGFYTFIEVPGQTSTTGTGRHIRGKWRNETDRFAPQTFAHAMEWLEKHYKENFFLYIDTWDPHEPWDAPPYLTELYYPGYDGELVYPVYSKWRDVPGFTEERLKKAHATYLAEVTMMDTWLGYFLRKLENMGLMDNTAIIFTTDHGFYFGEHDLLGKQVVATPSPSPDIKDLLATFAAFQGGAWGRSVLYEENIHIPLLIYAPGVTPGTYDGLTSAIDLMPTVLDYLGHDKPDWVEGNSLLPMVKDNSKKGREYVVSSQPFANPGEITRAVDDRERKTPGNDPTVTTDEWSLLYSMDPGESWLYNLKNDPKQENNVIDENVDVAKELHQLFVKFMQDFKVADHHREPRMELKLK